MKIFRKAIVALLTLIGWISPARAQFLGYVAQQTTQQTLATNTHCSGSAQTYSISNLGQTQHYLSIANVTGAQTFQAEIDGIDKQGNIFRISDVAELAGLSATRQGTIKGSGYYPQVQISITCAPGTATYTASYDGSQFTYDTQVGSYLTAQIDHVNWSGAPENANQTDTFQTPYGSSAGTLIFQVSVPQAGGSLTVQCGSNSITNVTNAFQIATLPATGGVQVFQIPDNACVFATVIYGNNGQAGTVATEYIFAPPGSQARANSDPCASGTYVKSTVAINGTGVIVAAPSAQTSTYVCGYVLSDASAATLQWKTGTGASCGTGTVNLSGPIPVLASTPYVDGSGGAMVMKGSVGSDLCLTASAGSGAGSMTVVSAP